MPIVPQYEPGRVAARPLNAPQVGVQASAASFGSRTAQAVGEIGRGVFDLGMMLRARNEREQGKKDTEAAGNLALQAEVELKTAMEGRVFARQGVDASSATDEAQKVAEEVRRKYQSQLKQGRQAEIFGAQFDHVSRQYLLGAVSHQTKQLEVATTTRRAAENQTAIERAAFFRNSPELIADAERTLAANAQAEFSGLPERAAAELKERRAALHMRVVDGFLQDGEEARAVGHLEANKAALGEELVGKVTAGLEHRRLQRDLLAMVEKGAGAEEVAAEVSARVGDPGKADDLMRYANTFIAARDRAAAKDSAAGMEAAWSALEKSRDPKDIDPRLPRAVRHQMQEWLQKGEGDAGRDPEPAIFEKIMRMTPEERRALAMDPAAYSEARQRLGGAKSKWWQTLDTRLQDELAGKSDPKKAGEAKGFLGDQELATKMWASASSAGGLKFADADEKSTRRDAFLLRYDRELMAAQEDAGEKPLTRQEKERIAARLLLPGALDDGRWFGDFPRRMAYEVRRDDRRFRPELPAEQRATVPANANVEYDPESGEFIAEVAGGREIVRPLTGERARKKAPEPKAGEPAGKSVLSEVGDFLDATGRMVHRTINKGAK